MRAAFQYFQPVVNHFWVSEEDKCLNELFHQPFLRVHFG
jgi:hypothetical protein